MDLVQKSLSVDFHQDKLTLVEYNGQPYIAMKPLVENMGLDWRSQQRKLTAKRWGMVKMTIPTNGDLQEMLCLPLRKLFGWLNTISPNKVKPELKQKIEVYQDECDDVLWAYWTNKNGLQEQYNEWLNKNKLSKDKGSFHGFGLNQRKLEKRVIEPQLKRLENLLQLSFGFIEVKAV